MIKDKTQTLATKHSVRGSVTAEFILIVPGFLFLCMLVIEISLWWVDKHFMRLAAFEAARSVLTESYNDPEDPCQDKNKNHEKYLGQAKRVVTLKMATVSPSVSYYKTTLASGLDLRSPTEGMDEGAPFARALIHVAERIPSAYALTSVKCKSDKQGGITTTVTYLRAPRMPFVGPAIWATYVLSRMNEQMQKLGLKGVVQFSLDDDYYEVLGAGSSRELVDLIRGYFSDGILRGADTLFSSQLSELQRAIDDQTKNVTRLIHAMPRQLRLIPMSVSVRMARLNPLRSNAAWDDGQAFLVAPFTTKNLNEDANWRQWALSMSESSEHLTVRQEEYQK